SGRRHISSSWPTARLRSTGASWTSWGCFGNSAWPRLPNRSWPAARANDSPGVRVRHLDLRHLPIASILSLPGSTTATTAASAGEAATTAAAPSTPARGFRHGRAEVARKTLQAAGKHDRRERAVPLVPARHRGAGIDAFERLRPAVHAAEDNRVGQILGEDFRFLGERLPVFLGRVHVDAES